MCAYTIVCVPVDSQKRHMVRSFGTRMTCMWKSLDFHGGKQSEAIWKYSQCSSSGTNFPRQQFISLYACYCWRVYCLPHVSKKQKWHGSKIMPTLSSKYFVSSIMYIILCVSVYMCAPCACKDLQTSEALNVLPRVCLQLNPSPLPTPPKKKNQKMVNTPVKSTFPPIFKKELNNHNSPSLFSLQPFIHSHNNLWNWWRLSLLLLHTHIFINIWWQPPDTVLV